MEKINYWYVSYSAEDGKEIFVHGVFDSAKLVNRFLKDNFDKVIEFDPNADCQFIPYVKDKKDSRLLRTGSVEISKMQINQPL